MPAPIRNLIRTFKRYGYRGARARTHYYVATVLARLVGPGRRCPICGWTGPEFHPIVYPADGLWRVKASCPKCGSFERHRALFFFYTEFFRDHPHHDRLLHFAPELCFKRLFEQHSRRYITSHYVDEQSDLKLDMANLALRNSSVALVVANGVIASVPDHARAVRNLHDVLVPGGHVLICDIVDPHKRSEELPDHPMGLFRTLGGLDVQEKFQPFEAELLNLMSFPPESDRELFGIRPDDFHVIRLYKRPA